MKPKTGTNLIVDVHAHVWTEEYLDLMRRFGKTDTDTQRGQGAGLSEEEMEARFDLMDRAGVDMQILSAAPQSPHFNDEGHAVELAKFVNDQYAGIVKRWPQRFAAFASLPLPHLEPSVRELRRALDELQMKGVAVTTSIAGRSLAHPCFAPIFEELNGRKSVLYIHPEGFGAHSRLIQESHMTWMIGAPMEDTICAAQLITKGIPSRYPDLKIILSHLGGAIPMLLQRMDNQYSWEAPETPEKPSTAAKRMWYDSVAHGHPPALRAAIETLGSDRIVFGTDFPYEKGATFQRAVEYIYEGASKEDAERILSNGSLILNL